MIAPPLSTLWNRGGDSAGCQCFALRISSRLDGPSGISSVARGSGNGDAAYGMSPQVLSNFIRIATHPRIFQQPSGLTEALAFASLLLDQPKLPDSSTRASPLGHLLLPLPIRQGRGKSDP